MKKIPYGLQNFETLIMDNHYYVDKTKYIEVLENLNVRYPVFLRPRKFGKSLWVVMMNYYYDIRHKDKFEKLFGNLYIGKNPTPLRNSYYVLNFDFSGLTIRDERALFESFRNKVYSSIKLFATLYKMEHLMNDIIENSEPADMLIKLFNGFQTLQLSNKIYIIIDEYDHFANELVGFRIESFKAIVSKTGFVRKFFETIKDGAKSVVDRIFITGVSPITLDSMMSEFNIAMNITLEPEFNSMLGFTKEEVLEMTKYYNCDEKIFEELQCCYDGYQFSTDANVEKVFNSDKVLYFLTKYQSSKKSPQVIVDPNISSDYTKIQKLIELNPNYKNLLTEILNNEEISTTITREFNLEREQTRDDFLSLMFYLGFLTIRRGNTVETILSVPNYGMQVLYYDYFANLLKLEKIDIPDVIKKMAYYGGITKLCEKINEILKNLLNRDFIKFDEKHIKLVIITYILQMPHQVYIVKSEYEVEGGYIDIMLWCRYEEIKYELMIELKYLKKENTSEEIIAEKLSEARRQVERYCTAKELS